MQSEALIHLTADIASAYVANHQIDSDHVGRLVSDVHQALASLVDRQSTPEAPEPVVSVRASVKKDHLVCLVCGEKMKMLKRHLRVQHDMEPKDYRAAYNLPEDYPLVASDYAERRSDLAKEIGFGRHTNRKSGRKAGSKSGKSSIKGK